MVKLAAGLLSLVFCLSAWGQQSPSTTKPESQTAAKPELITIITLDSIQEIVRAMGFQITHDKDDKGNPNTYFSFRAEGYKVFVQVPDPDFIWLYNAFTGNVTVENINEWNADNRFSRAYVSADKILNLDTEIVVKNGVTQQNIEVQIEEFRDSVAKWARFLIDHEKPSAVPNPTPPAAK
ncbi:MAG TPA: YbjN domain-containing protein [Terriglobales bacterium]